MNRRDSLKREAEILINSPLIITHPYLNNLYLHGVDIEGHPIWAELPAIKVEPKDEL